MGCFGVGSQLLHGGPTIEDRGACMWAASAGLVFVELDVLLLLCIAWSIWRWQQLFGGPFMICCSRYPVEGDWAADEYVGRF